MLKQKSCHKPEWKKVYADQTVDMPAAAVIVPRTQRMFFQEASACILCAKDRECINGAAHKEMTVAKQ